MPPLTPTPINEPPPVYQRISWWMENTIVRVVKRVYNDIRNNLKELFKFSLGEYIDELEAELISLLDPFISQILSIPGMPTYITEPIRRARTGQYQVGIVVLVALGTALVAGITGGMNSAIGSKTSGLFNNLFKSFKFDPEIATILWKRGIINDTQIDDIYNLTGMEGYQKAIFKEAVTPMPDDAMLLTAFWRGQIQEPAIDLELRKRGYKDHQITWWKNRMHYIPNPDTLISMAVREAFDDSIAARFSYDENLPPDFVFWAEKQGMSPEWSKRAWRAHWRLPGLVQVREMFYRGIINQTDVDQYLLASDIPRFWRVKLINWMFREVTRVDVRRMYNLGVIDIQEVYQRNLKVGYTPADAALLTQWTQQEYAQTERELTKTDILALYRESILNLTETTNFLRALDYKTSDIGLLLAREDLKRHKKFEKDIIEQTRLLFINDYYTRTQVVQELGALNPPGAFIDEKLAVWTLEKRRRRKRPSVSQIRDMYIYGAVDQAWVRAEFAKEGWDNAYTDTFINLWRIRYNI